MNLSCTSRHFYNIKNSSITKPTTASLLVFLFEWKKAHERPAEKLKTQVSLKVMNSTQHSEQLHVLAHTWHSADFEVHTTGCELVLDSTS